MSADKPRRLGRGLEALLAVTQPPATAKPAAPGEAAVPAESGDTSGTQVQHVSISSIRANPYQPRKEFRDEELADLEASLKATGLLQPITLRPAGRNAFELIAGERRLRAATRLGWSEIPAIVREVDDRTLLTLAIVENLQRVDLNPLEEAEGFKRLIDEFGLTQQQVADVVGKDRTTVTNLLRVLTLPDPVRALLRDSAITLGHARALLGLSDARAMQQLANVAVAEALSVREVERRVRALNEPIAPAERTAPARSGSDQSAPPLSSQMKLVEDRLRRKLQTDVSIAVSAGDKGSIRIGFYSADDLERVLDVMLGADRSDFD
ncbi:MAG TPA: ParB/RepB/Spo0J family partition protein [Gemmatimonadaceae bacterium]|nr:ParB/RepB/Spo0J family partition protein [Gemmatimonadaceae bacterium]